MRVGAVNFPGGGDWVAGGCAGSPGRRKRGGVTGLPSSEGCSSSATTSEGGADVCAMLAVGASANAMPARAAVPSAQRRRAKSDPRAPKPRPVPAVRLTSGAAKANHRQRATPAPGRPRTAAAQKPARAAKRRPDG
jgi:hypothetical protein